MDMQSNIIYIDELHEDYFIAYFGLTQREDVIIQGGPRAHDLLRAQSIYKKQLIM